MRPARAVLLGMTLFLAISPVATAARDQAVVEARAQLERGDYEGALQAAKDILLEDPSNPGALYVAGVAALNLDRLNDAEKFLEKASRVAPEAPEVEYQLGVVLARMAGEFAGRGKTRIADGLYEEALLHFEKELERSPQHAGAIAGRALAYLESGKPEDATKAFEQWIATNPDNLDGYLALIRLYTEEGRADDARGILAKMPARDLEQNADATFLVARSYYLQDRPDEGRSLLEPLTKLPAKPWQVPALQALNRLSLGQAHEAALSLIEFVDRNPPPGEVEPIAAAYHELSQQLRRAGGPEGERDTMPKLTLRTPPKYPVDARRYGVEGKVLLLAIVEKDGSVGRLSVISTTASRHESLYRPQFERSALDAVSQWRYEPALRDGKPEAFPITIHLDFSRE